MPKGIKGALSAFPMVIFAFTGIEMVGLTSGETANPKRDLPKAINTLLFRIALFYVGAMFVLMCIYPWNKVTTSASPFVQVFSALGVKVAAGVINFVVLTAALSACNSALFSTSRTLFVLSHSKFAPRKMGEVNNRSVPVTSLVFSSLTLLIIVVLNFILPAKIFEIISDISTVCFIFVWLTLIWCHYKYRRQNPEGTSFKMPLYPISNFVTMAFFIGILGLLLLQKEMAFALLFACGWVVLMFIAYGIYRRKA